MPMAFLRGGGETGALIEARDWSQSPLGPLDSWPQSLRTAVGIVLRSPVPIVLFWGADGVMLYNDAYSAFAGARHPQLLGCKVREGWPEVADLNDHVMKVCLAGGTLAYRDRELTLDRNGAAEQVWMNLDYSPVPDESGAPAGVMGIVVESTARVLAERGSGAERERLRRMFDQAPGFKLMLRGPEHRIEFTNSAYMQLIGHRDVLGKTIREALPEVVGQGFFELLDRVYSSGEPFVGTGAAVALQRSPEGPVERRFLDFVYQPNFDEKGAVTGIFVEGYDVTGARLAEEALRASEEFNRRILASSADCIKVLDLDARIEFMSEGGMCVMEVDDFGTIEGACWPDFWKGAEHGRAIAAVEEARRGGTGRFQGFATTSKGSPRWWDVIVTAIDGPDGRPEKLLSISRDISAAREAEDRLRELNTALEERFAERTAERDMLANIVEKTDVMVMAADLDYNILAINKANADEFERIYGIRPRLGDNMLELLADRPEHQAQVREGWARALAGEELTFVAEFGDEARCRPAYEISFRNLTNEAGERVGAYQFVTDVTERIRRERQLVETQEALRQSQKVEALGQLTGGIAHDFNNLLTVIRGSADLLRRRELSDEKRRRYIEAISDTADRAAKLTSQLLAFARRQSLRPEIFDTAERIRGIEEMLGTLIGSHISLSIERIGERDCFVEADAAQFETALVNMAVNARDAMDGEGALTVSVEVVPGIPRIRGHHRADGEFVAISVTDTGSGIAPEHLDRIFEPFFTTKEVGKGTGLGLSQLFGFAKQSGGEVDVRSTLGEGTTFTLYLPRADSAGAVPAASADPAAFAPRGHILVVEDNEEVGRFATDLIADLGYRTTLARNAGEALQKLEEEEEDAFSIVFSDVVMPGMGGVELARRIRERWPALPVVLTSGYSHVLVEDTRHGFPLLKKPYSVEDLSRALRQAAAQPA